MFTDKNDNKIDKWSENRKYLYHTVYTYIYTLGGNSEHTSSAQGAAQATAPGWAQFSNNQAKMYLWCIYTVRQTHK